MYYGIAPLWCPWAQPVGGRFNEQMNNRVNGSVSPAWRRNERAKTASMSVDLKRMRQ